MPKAKGATGSDLMKMNFRSMVTPRFKSLLDVKKSRDKILTKEDFDIAKGDMEQKLQTSRGRLRTFCEGSKHSDARSSTIEELTSDLITGRSSKDWFPYDIPENIKIDAGKFRAELRRCRPNTLRLNWARGRTFRVQGAIIPQETSKTVKPIFKEAGIKKSISMGLMKNGRNCLKSFLS